MLGKRAVAEMTPTEQCIKSRIVICEEKDEISTCTDAGILGR